MSEDRGLVGFGEETGSDDLSSFSLPSQEKPVKSEISDNTVAVQGAILSPNPEEVFNSYMELSSSSDEERQASMEEITNRLHQESTAFSQNLASQMLLDPDISTEQANSIVQAMAGMPENKPNSMDMVSEKVGAMPSGDEDGVSEDIRLDATELSRHVNARMRQKQALLNGHLLSTNKGGLHATGDLLEQLVPLTDGLITAQLVNEVKGGSVGSSIKAMALLGSAKTEIKEYYMGLSSDQQVAFERALAEALNNTTGITFTNDNDLAQKDIFMSIVEGNYYGDFDKYLDNIVGMLDLIGVGALLRPVKMVGMAAKISNVTRRFVRSEVQPASPIRTVGETNPEEARKMQVVAEADNTGDAAKATHGATREDAIVDSEAPQVRTEDGSVEGKVHNLAKTIKDFIYSGRIDVSESELLGAQREGVKRLQKLNGVTNRTEMAQYKSPELNSDGTSVYQNVYGPADSSYKTPQEGIDNVLFALRDYGVDESNLTVLRKSADGDYVPTTIKEVEAKAALRDAVVKKKKKLPEELRKDNLRDDYLIQVNFEHDFDPMDVKWDKLQVKRNFFDRIPFFSKGEKGKASLQRSLVDIHSMLDPRITLGANVAVDRASAIETAIIKHAEDFVNPFTNLAKDRQEALMEVIDNNNFTGKLTSKKTLKANGYTPEEIDLLDKWKDSWDQLYHLENLDLVKSLRAGGYQRFTDEANGTELVARSMGRNFLGSVRSVYDSALGKTRVLSDKELDDLYAAGGTIAKLRGPEKIDGKNFEHVLVRNQENKSQLRDFRDDDRVLNYREGYYTVRYKDPHIIVRETTEADGTVVSQAVKTAGSKKDAELAVANLTRGTDDPAVTYRFRDNRDRSVGQMDDDAWSIHSTSGRTSQRLRGERLGTTEANVQGKALGAVEGPAEALLNSVRSISRRTSMRDYIERYKMRFMDNYEDLLKIDQNSGQLKFPKNSADFKDVEESSSKRLADARTNLEYIHYLENGYRNGLDDSWKALLNGTADILGGTTKYGERMVRAVVDEIQNPTTWFKARAFDAYLALNPMRQFVVQGHQASLLAANFPKYVLSQKLAKDMAAIHMVMIAGDKLKDVKGIEKLIGMKYDEAKALAEEYRKTGFDATIDRNNLVENGLDHLVDTENLARTKKLYKSVVAVNRKIGFDAGERINIMSSWLAHRNKALEEGKDITSKRVNDEIMAKARNYTFNMNAAGDMPYNKNSLALLFQFMQVPHKAMLQMTNRALSRTERTKLAAYNAVLLVW